MSTPILATKLYIPPLRLGIVLRPRLVGRLNENLAAGYKLSLISASAGSGKTTLVSEWVACCGRPVAWLSLDEGDNDPTRFLAYIIAALQTLTPKFGEGIFIRLQSPQAPPIESLLTSLLNEIATLPEQFILVLDDYHVIESKPVEQALAFLLDNQPPQMHLVIASREDPSLPLARLRVHNQMTELRAADLRFTTAESSEFFNHVMELNLSETEIATLEARTEGWIAGLQLAALSMQGQKDIAGFIQSFTGNHRFVLDYLLEEVFKRQPKNIQEFLLCTSILERLCGPLCDAVLNALPGLGQETLAALERANMFVVPLDNERHWYRYHHLFGELLRKRLGTPAELSTYHLRASRWYEANDLFFDAFRHAAAANDIECAERLLTSGKMDLYIHSVTQAALDWLASLNPQVLDAHPQLRVRAAALSLMAGQTNGVEAHIQAAENALQGVALNESTRDLLGQMACARATLALTRYDPAEMILQARIALEYLHPGNLSFRFTANWALASASLLKGDRLTAAQACRDGLAISQQSGDMFSIILATSDLGTIQELDTQLFQAEETYLQALELSGEYPQPNMGEVHLGLARIYYEWNDLETAEEHGRQSLELTRLYDREIDRFIISEVFLARLELARGEVDRAADMLAKTEQTARKKNFTLRLPEIADMQVLVLLRQGKLSAAAELAHHFELPLCKARIFLTQGDLSAALSILGPFRKQMETRGWEDERLRALVLQAITLYKNDERDQSRQTLAEVLALAEPSGFIRLFVDEGEVMRLMISEFRFLSKNSTHISNQNILSYTDRLLANFESLTKNQLQMTQTSTSGPRPSSLVKALSQRELEILHLIAQGFSNQEISEKLFLALDTVKGHNRRIYNKLQVQRRTEAIARARELGLL